MNKKELEIYKFEMHLKNFFYLYSKAKSENRYGLQRSGLKTGVENDIFAVKQGQDLENQAANPHQEFQGVPPFPPQGKKIKHLKISPHDELHIVGSKLC